MILNTDSFYKLRLLSGNAGITKTKSRNNFVKKI